MVLPLIATLLCANPEVHFELTTHSAYTLGNELNGGMQDVGARFELHLEDVRLITEAWVRPFNATNWAVVDWGDGQFSTRVAGGHLSGGLDGEVRPTFYWVPGSGEFGDYRRLMFACGPSLGVSFGDDKLRFEARVAWMVLSPSPDPTRVVANAEVTWRVVQLRVGGGVGQLGLLRATPAYLYPFFSVALGLRFRW